jgi:hypothetical protein
MSGSVTVTQAQIRRAIKAAESAGLRVRQVTVKPDGSIAIDSKENDIPAMDSPKTSLASWEDM